MVVLMLMMKKNDPNQELAKIIVSNARDNGEGICSNSAADVPDARGGGVVMVATTVVMTMKIRTTRINRNLKRARKRERKERKERSQAKKEKTTLKRKRRLKRTPRSRSW
jgi:hypothetical protein